MKEYTVRPNKDADEWFVKIEDVSPEKSYPKMDEAIRHAEKAADDNRPARLIIYNHHNDIVDEKTYR
ncbi:MULTISPECIES: DUF2188 domain-containing protein [Alteribacter]|uniref:DUF2188 domain-containing protein n=1 Tax=Alteribacter keqinensis TaxID=2483800 RepID=A0A3M7TS65_9BACI|nr:MULTISPECIES: DUF2188 domain-containing protein [Alteribacter]MBM7097920.1 DUF2188 domain-containing protein [Alteribacter salitolerans]RNA68446.1 DUF2188 domain-containing protein [Alteribacter keqinensis]